MAKENLIWKYDKQTDCLSSDFKGIEYFIQTIHWAGKRINKLYVVADGKHNHVTGGKPVYKLQKLAELDLIRKLDQGKKQSKIFKTPLLILEGAARKLVVEIRIWTKQNKPYIVKACKNELQEINHAINKLKE